MKRFFFIILTIIIFLSVPFKSYAQIDYYSLTKKTALGITPGISEIVLDKDVSSIKTVTINNLTNFTLPIKVSVEGLNPSETNAIPQNLLYRYDSSKWFSIKADDKDFILQPKESKNVTVEIKQPEDAGPGGYYASLIFQPLIPEELFSNDSVFIYSRVASVFLLQIKGDLDETIKFVDLKVPVWLDSSNLDYDLILQNTGNTHSRPLIKLTFKDLIGNQSYPDDNIQPELILPGLNQEYKGTYTNLPQIGIVKISTFTTYGPSNTLTLAPDRYVLVLPFKYIGILVGIFIILFLLRSQMRWRISKALKVLIKGEQYQMVVYKEKVKKKSLLNKLINIKHNIFKKKK